MNILLVGGLGYIGTYLNEYLLNLGFVVDICDHSKSLNLGPNISIKYPYNYSGLTAKDLSQYDCILWFAGHSSVSESNSDPIGALNNNMINLIDFLKKIPNDDTLFIYASTASLYTGVEGPAKEDAKVVPYENAYDISKFAFDYLAPRFHKKIIGLRMGTLSGYSVKMRPELIFNSMMLSAYFKGEVKVANKEKIRSILFLSDLAEIVKILLTINISSFGFYNASSYTFTIGEIGEKISHHVNAKVIELPKSETYSFSIDNSKIQTLGFKNTFSFTEQMEKFIGNIKNANYIQK
jgi:UDP-glucose 4-epimerase